MTPTIDLSQLKSAVTARIRKLTSYFCHKMHSSGLEKNAASAFCVLELDNLIINLHREFIISSLYSRSRTCSGHKVTHNNNFATQDAAALYVMSVLEPVRYSRYAGAISLTRREETKIRDPLKLQLICSSCGMSNSNAVVTALSLNSTAFTQIATFRNFYAHRNRETARKVKTLASGIGLTPVDDEWETVSQLIPGSPATLFESWSFDIELFTEFLLE